jgi:hypothetical protein
MSFTKKLLTETQKQSIHLLELILTDISETHNINYEDLQQKYIIPLQPKTKRDCNKKGKMTGYSCFLKDKSVTENIKKQYANDVKSFGGMSKIKGNIWSSMSIEDKKMYEEKANEHNKKLELNSN